MTLDSLFDDLERSHKEFVVYSGATDAAVVDRFAARNADVEHRTLPGDDPEGFLVVRDRDGFLGALPVDELRRALAAPIPDPWERDGGHGDHRALFDLLDGTLLVSLDRRRMLSASREVEEHAWRVGAGTLYAGFQTAAAFQGQRSVYERLAGETALDVHVYTETVPEAAPPGIAFHTGPADVVGRFWFVAFDGCGDDSRKCAVVGRQRDADTYAGFWTYDPGTVEAVIDAVSTDR